MIVSIPAAAVVVVSGSVIETSVRKGGDLLTKWNIDQSWYDRISGKSCKLCDELKRGDETSMGLVVSEMRVCRWILAKNQYIRGYSILVLAEHRIELFELDSETRHQFMDDISDVSRILSDTLSPIKINVEMQGNVVPHLHCHVKPRFAADTPGHARIFQSAGTVIPDPAEFSGMRDKLRERMPGIPKPGADEQASPR